MTTNFIVHDLGSKQIRVLFDYPVDGADDLLYYSITAVSSAPIFLPIINAVEYYDADSLSVVLTLSDNFTNGKTYACTITGLVARNASPVSNVSVDFISNDYDPPKILGAYQSIHNCIDILCDRSVGANSTTAMASIALPDGSSPTPMLLVPWTSAIPSNTVRFTLNGATDSSSYIIQYSNIIDAQFNTSVNGNVELSIGYVISAYNDLLQARITKVIFTNLINTPGKLVSFIRVYFNCNMNGGDVLNTGNWNLTQNGSSISIVSIYAPFIFGVTNFASSANCDVVNDEFTWFVDLQVNADTNYPILVSVSASSEDNTSVTNPSLTVKSNVANGPPNTLSVRTFDNSVCLRTFGEFLLYDGTPISLLNSNMEPVSSNLSISASSTFSNILFALNNLINAYSIHVGTSNFSAVHIVTDTVNTVSFSNCASLLNLDHLIYKANLFVSIYNNHVSSSVYHTMEDSGPQKVTLDAAVDLGSLIAVLNSTISMFVLHNSSGFNTNPSNGVRPAVLSMHIYPGSGVFNAPLNDLITINTSGLTNNNVYEIMMNGFNIYYDNTNGGKKCFNFGEISGDFVGVNNVPVLVSSIPRSGMNLTYQTSMILTDAIELYFSKSMTNQSLFSSNFSVSGGLVLNDAYWINDKCISVCVSNMSNIQYSVGATGLYDLYENPVL